MKPEQTTGWQRTPAWDKDDGGGKTVSGLSDEPDCSEGSLRAAAIQIEHEKTKNGLDAEKSPAKSKPGTCPAEQ
jgi:hypothetical protein